MFKRLRASLSRRHRLLGWRLRVWEPSPRLSKPETERRRARVGMSALRPIVMS